MDDYNVLYEHGGIATGGVALFVWVLVGALYAGSHVVGNSFLIGCVDYPGDCYWSVVFIGHSECCSRPPILRHVEHWRTSKGSIA